jgi:hypothetical protein
MEPPFINAVPPEEAAERLRAPTPAERPVA